MKVQELVRYRRESRNGRRFYTMRDMAIIKLEDSIRNSQIKRGVVKVKGENYYIHVCGCGVEGCFIHGSFESTT